ncbi:MAG: sigma-70 family RNA polymerase sigma factor [bacterium]|nr:sigma-70 family RNA polymerase sigma factor [bacterium]
MAQPLSPRLTDPVADTRAVPFADSDDWVEAVYRQHSAKMWRALLAYSGDPDVASDAVAEAFAQALRRGSAIHHVERWVWRASFRIADGELKARRRLVAEVDASIDSPCQGFEFQDALMQVSPKQRASLFLFYYAGYPPGEIANMIGSTQSAVRVHLFRGRKRLAEILTGGRDD